MAAPGACKGGYKPPVEIWAAVRRPRGFCSRRGLVQPGCTPHFLFPLAEKKRECTVQKKRPLGRAPVQWPSARNGGRRIGACSDLDWPSGTLCSSAIPVAAVPWRMAPTSSGWLSHGAASLFATAHAPAKNPAARSAAERAEREADQMRPCTPLTFAPAPRESASRPVPHPAAPVGRSSKPAGTISRQLPYSNFARTCKVATKSVFSLTPGAARSLFGADKKRMGGASPVETAPWREPVSPGG